MQKEEIYQDFSNGDSDSKKNQKNYNKKKQHIIKKDKFKKDKRKKDQHKNQLIQQEDNQEESKPQMTTQNNIVNNNQNQTSKYQKLIQFWKNDIDKHYKKEITEQNKNQLKQIKQSKAQTVLEIFKNRNQQLSSQKISLQYLQRYCNLIQQINSLNCSFIVLEHQNKREFYVIVLDQFKNIEKAIQVTEEQLALLAKRQQIMTQIIKKIQLYTNKFGGNHYLTQLQMQITFLTNFKQIVKKELDKKLQQVYNKAINQPQYVPPAKVQQKYITFLIKKNLKKALQNQQIDYFNHFKKNDINQHERGLIDTKPILEKKDFDQYIKKKKGKKIGKKTRNVLKTACAGCLSYFYQLYNPLQNCTQCHIRFHKYCYIPKTIAKNISICQSCFLSKNNQTKKSRINQCQLCGTKGFLYLPMDQSNNAHIFCMLINGLWKFKNTQIHFQKRYILNAIENKQCIYCKQTNSCIYKCECCENYSHPLCAYINGWNLKLQDNQMSSRGHEMVKLQCCNGVDLLKNEKRRRFILNYKKCVFNQCQ